MKNIIKKSSYLFLTALLLGLAMNVMALEKEGVIRKEYDIDNNTRIEFFNKNSDLQIKTWDKQTVKVECFYKITANDEKDISLTLDALENPDVNKSPRLLKIETGIFQKINSKFISGLIQKFTGTLMSGTVVDLKEYKINYILTLPDHHELMISQKYSEVNIPDYSGRMELDLYDVDLYAGKLANATILKAKYSNLDILSLGNCEVDIYDTDVELRTMGDVNLVSKYSKFEAESVGRVIMNSYDDKIKLLQLKSIEGTSKYTDFILGSVEFADLDLYDCELEAKDCGELKMIAKYSGIEFDNINIFKFPECYDNTVKAKFVGEFSTDSKYTDFEFGHIAGMIDFITYDDKLTVSNIDPDFYLIKINGKYTEVDLKINGNPRFFLDVNFSYADYDLPDSVLFSYFETKSSKYIASGRTEGLSKSEEIKVRTESSGIRKANIGQLKVEQYDGGLIIRN